MFLYKTNELTNNVYLHDQILIIDGSICNQFLDSFPIIKNGLHTICPNLNVDMYLKINGLSTNNYKLLILLRPKTLHISPFASLADFQTYCNTINNSSENVVIGCCILLNYQNLYELREFNIASEFSRIDFIKYFLQGISIYIGLILKNSSPNIYLANRICTQLFFEIARDSHMFQEVYNMVTQLGYTPTANASTLLGYQSNPKYFTGFLLKITV
jgi:hypothetical protein